MGGKFFFLENYYIGYIKIINKNINTCRTMNFELMLRSPNSAIFSLSWEDLSCICNIYGLGNSLFIPIYLL